MTAPDRYPGLDALRAAGAVAVISIHATVEPGQTAWPALGAPDRFANHLADSLSRFAVAGFVAASFFLLARSLDRRPEPYRAVARARAARLIPAYLFWSALFMVVQGLRNWRKGGFAWTGDPLAWARALLLGVEPNMFHLWFIPMLFALTLAYPVPRALARRSGVAAILAAAAFLAAWRALVVAAPPWVHDSRAGDFWWRGAAVVGYASYATLGWAAYRALAAGIPERTRRALLLFGALAIGASLAVFVRDAATQSRSATEIPADLLSFAALYTYPAGVFALFVFGVRADIPRPLARLAEASFGIYLAHPLGFIPWDSIERRGVNPGASGLFLLRIATTLAIAWALSTALARVPGLRRFVR